MRLTKPKKFTIWPFTEKFANPWTRQQNNKSNPDRKCFPISVGSILPPWPASSYNITVAEHVVGKKCTCHYIKF